jgi:hypothetical protein
VAAIGWRYDLANVFDLARYLIPVTVVPSRWRVAALHFGSGEPTEVICSSLIARLFDKVRFPIVPSVTFPSALPGGDPQATQTHETRVRPEIRSAGGARSEPPARGRIARRIFGQPSDEYTGILRMRHPTLITPRDFDLSPFFDIVKQNPFARGSFDYSRLHWAEDDDDREAG